MDNRSNTQSRSQLSPKKLDELLVGPTEVNYLVDPIIPPGTSGLIAGESGSYKTWLSLFLALAVALGIKWLGKFETLQGPVLIVDEENADLLLRVRLWKLIRGLGIDPSKLPIYFLIGKSINFSPIINRSNGKITLSESYNQLLEITKSLKPALIILDSLTRVHRANENNANEIAAVFANVKKLVDDTGASCLFNHHFNKSTYGSGKSGARIRGSSDIRAFCDFTLLIEKKKDGILVTHDKSRWSEPVSPFMVDFNETSDDGITMTFSEFLDDKDGNDKRDVWKWLVEILWDGPKTRPEIVDLAKANAVCGTRNLDSDLSWRTEKEYLLRQNGRPITYSLTEKGRNTPAGRAKFEEHELNNLFDSSR